MSRIQEILGVGLIIHDLFVIITGLIVFTGQKEHQAIGRQAFVLLLSR